MVGAVAEKNKINVHGNKPLEEAAEQIRGTALFEIPQLRGLEPVKRLEKVFGEI